MYGWSKTSLTVAHCLVDEVLCALLHERLVAGPPKVVEPVWDMGVDLPDTEYLVLDRAAVGDRDLLVGAQCALPETVNL